jgi:hypothetical protein
VEYTLADHAIPGQTPRDQPEGALALPGRYTVELAAGGQRDSKTLVIRADPRVRASEADLATQIEIATRVADALAVSYDGYTSLRALRADVASRVKALTEAKAAKAAVDAVQAVDKKLDAVQNGTAAAPGLGPANRDLARYYQMLLSGDARPAERLRASIAESCHALTTALQLWRALNATELPPVNKMLAAAKQAALPQLAAPATPACAP